MNELSFRQVHLDFHTSEEIDAIGSSFSKKQFQEALRIGHVNSITVFSKCHHGWAYHPSKANEMHPGLSFDLLGSMIEAAHEIGVKTPVYISGGFDEKMARRHPEWLGRNKEETTQGTSDFISPGYHLFCLNSQYLPYLLAQVEEVVRNYDADGIFLDIVGVVKCYCQNCVSTARQKGKDPRDTKAMQEIWENTYANYTKSVENLVNSIKPGMRIFHNCGHIPRGRRDLAKMNTHLEIESLPTGGWGYDHFPLSARYAGILGMDFLSMTGKFHTTWGEFGGFKHPNALRYEVALSMANGAKCSIGDQLHPEGLMDEATYKLIGSAYSEAEVKEEWCREAGNIADIGMLSVEAIVGQESGHGIGNIGKSDSGAVRMLLEGKFLFDVLDNEADFTKYKVLILPDRISVNEKLKDKLEEYLKKGGKILATGESGLSISNDEFAIDLGVKWIKTNPYCPDYFRPLFELQSLASSAYIFYTRGQKVELTGGIELGRREDPYFNRDMFTFCSHQHTPNSFNYGGPGMVESTNGIYIAWNVFEDYATKGSITLKEAVVYALEKLLCERKSLDTNLPAQGIVTLTRQDSQKRYVNHLLYASPVKRGNDIEVIEDILPLYDVNVTLKIDEVPKKVYLAPQLIDLEFSVKNGATLYTVPKFECHQMVVLEY
ncbi:MAG: beta-galactosidase trimerization domain-containing protein [Vallitaleaceae bacterium]|nr:beta-galactosidase trimerization domain-containing protein [Vallitaleaceae bacterium]